MNATTDFEARLRDTVHGLPEKLQAHIQRVEDGAAELAQLHQLDEHRARLAALGHDLVRHKSNEELLHLCGKYGHQPDSVEVLTPIMVHGPVAALMLSRDFGFEDAEVLAGIDCHTTARAGMSPIEQVLFIADKIEPHKIAREPERAEVMIFAQGSLDAGVLRYLDFLLSQALKGGLLLHPRTLEARNHLLGKINHRN